ncbi:MAG: sporulation integral membrane protein YtvI [Clostridia bacterium]|nr:sporulation integral membrane protein YtvI [Clostridia bacterium]
MKPTPPNLGHRLTVVFLLLAILYLLYYHLLPAVWQVLTTVVPWLLPFVLAWFLAALLDPLVDWLEQRGRCPRTLASLAAVLILVLLLIILAVLVFGQLAVELSRLVADFPRVAGAIKEGLAQLDTLYRSWQLPPQIMATAETAMETLVRSLRELLNRLTGELIALLGSIPRLFVSLIVTLVATFFFSRDKRLIRKGLLSLFPWLDQPRIIGMGQELGAGVVGYFKAQGFLITLTALQVMAGLYLLRIKYALSLSLFIAVLDILPVVGPGTVFLPWAGWEFLHGRYPLGLALVILYITITIVRQILEPKVVGVNLGLHPLAVLISIYLGVQALGLAGAVLGPLLLVLLKAAHRAGLLKFSRWSGKD